MKRTLSFISITNLTRGFQAGRANRFGATLFEVARGLREATRSTEGGFVSILESLQACLTRARALSYDYLALADSLTSGDAAFAQRELSATLEWAANVRLDGSVTTLLKRSERGMRGLKEGALDLYQAARLFRVLGVTTRVELQRLGTAGADFQDLASMVENLATDLAEKSEGISAASAGVSETINRALAAAGNMQTRSRRNLPVLLRTASESLRTLMSSQREATEFSRMLAEDFNAIAGDISETINSIQYEDITRQRLEHVAEAIEQASARLRFNWNGAIPEAAAIAKLESVQLRGAATDFGLAVGRIEEAVGRIAARIADMANQAGKKLASIGPEGRIFFDLERGLSAVATAIEEYNKSAGLLGRAEECIAPAIVPISGFAPHISEIGIRMQRISLNANVKAARLEAAGEAVSAIADAIQQAVTESNAQTERLLKIISEAPEWSSGIASGADAAGCAPGELLRLTGILRVWDRNASAQTSKLRQTALDLSSELLSSVSLLDSARPLSQKLLLSAQTLEESASAWPDQAVTSERLETLKATYTMQAERSLHSSTLNGGSTLPLESGADENVEIF